MYISLLLALLVVSLAQPPAMEQVCSADQLKRFVDISSARIQKSKTYQYDLTLLDTPISIIKNGTHITFKGDFATLTLRNNNLKKEYVYKGTEMLIKIPADHVFSLQKPANLQIQILFYSEEMSKDNIFHYIMLSQLYVISKFKQNIETVLSQYFNDEMKEGDVVQTSKIVKLIQGFPLLMYRGSVQSFPCRNNLLCFLKREYQLISQADFQQVKSFVNREEDNSDRKAVKRKNIYEVQAIIKDKKQVIRDEEL